MPLGVGAKIDDEKDGGDVFQLVDPFLAVAFDSPAMQDRVLRFSRGERDLMDAFVGAFAEMEYIYPRRDVAGVSNSVHLV